MKNFKMKLLIITIVFSLLIVGCNNSNMKNNTENSDDLKEQEKNYEPAFGGEISLPIDYIKTLNPLLNKSESLYNFYKLVYEGLFEFNEEQDLYNKLAQDYEITNDGRTINIKLRENVKWHDGEKFSAEDVKFTINFLKYASNNSTYKKYLNQVFKPLNTNDIEHIFHITVIDEHNITIDFDRSYSSALESLVFPIIPKHQFEANSKRESYQKVVNIKEDFKPIGTGPYKFIEYNKLKDIKLKSNDVWWGGSPYIDSVVGKIVEDKKLAITAFDSRKIDVTKSIGVDWEKFADNKDTKIYEYVTPNYEFLAFNFTNNLFSGEEGKIIRKAIAYGVDIQSIIEKVYLGHATESDLPIMYNSWLLNDEGDMYGYNKDKAKEILKEAGFKDSDGNGILESPSGKTLSFKLLTNSYNPLRRETANLIIDNLKEIGISIEADFKQQVKGNPSEEAIEKDWQKVIDKTKRGNFDIVLIGWELSKVPDLSFAFHSREGQNNFINYENKKLDNLLVDAFRANTRDEKKKIYDEIQKVLFEDLPYVGLFFRNNGVLVDRRIMGDINPHSFNLYNNIDKWFIPKELQNNSTDDEESNTDNN